MMPFSTTTRTSCGTTPGACCNRTRNGSRSGRRPGIRIDGHCDERGTAEYNLALGERRADVVKEYLTSLGVTPDRIQTRSLGKEAPFCRDSGESCWSQNRRGHLVITDK